MILRTCILVAAIAWWPATAAGQNCSISMPNIAFGNVNGVGQGNVDRVGQIRVTCTNGSQWVRACIALGAPVDNSWDPRYMASGPRRLQYNIFADSGYSQIWGSVFGSAGTQYPIDVYTNYGTSSATSNFYARVPVQDDAQTSNYTAAFGSSDGALRVQGYSYSAPPPCGNWAVQQQFGFTVSARVDPDCSITTTPLNFPVVDAGLARVDVVSTGTISATCTQGAAYTLSLDEGQGFGGNPARREMKRDNGVGLLGYDLYVDAAHTQLWGDGSRGTVTVSGTGLGVTTRRNHTVYGVLPAQIVQLDGTYRDQVTVTVTY